jgi:mannosyltransferase OCH1-like enzyme
MRIRRKRLLIISIIGLGIFVLLLVPYIINKRLKYVISSRTVYESDIIRYSNSTLAKVRIPRIIHQTYRTHDVPPKWNLTVQSVMEKNIDNFKYRRWSDDEIHAFVKEYEPHFYRKTFINYPYNIQRVDSFRYVLMFHLGGIYIDMDNGCNRPFRDLINTLESLDPYATYLAAFPLMDSFYVDIEFLISSAGHPLYKQLISRLHLFNHNYLIYWWTIFMSTGPTYATIQQLLFSSSQQSVVRLLGYPLLRPMFIRKENGLSWIREDQDILRYLVAKSGIIFWYCKMCVIITIIFIFIKSLKQIMKLLSFINFYLILFLEKKKFR